MVDITIKVNTGNTTQHCSRFSASMICGSREHELVHGIQ